MENKKCSYSKHQDFDAIIYCQECNKDMCKKCINLHQQLFEDHHTYKLDNNKVLFINLCKENNHMIKYQYYCKDHNILCCSSCIAKIDVEGNGQHKDCNIYSINNIKNEKKNKLSENIKYLEDLSNRIEDKIKELKILFEKINQNKDELQLKIQKIFTQIRNVLNQREDELLLEIDNYYNELFCIDNIINKSKILPKKIKITLEKGKSIENEWNNENKLNSLINDCINIENNIKDIDLINDNIDKLKEFENIKIIFVPENNSLNNFINNIKHFGSIFKLDSVILTNIEDIDLFYKLISSRIKLKNMKLLYKATKDGIEFENVKNKVEGKTNLIFLFCVESKIFGAFINCKLDNIQSGKYFNDENAFVFSLCDNKIFEILIPEKAIHFRVDHTVLIGNTQVQNGFWIYKGQFGSVSLSKEPTVYNFQKSNIPNGIKNLTELEIFEINS